MKVVYSRLMFLLFYKTSKWRSNYRTVGYKKLEFESFFGYYDKSPSNENDMVLSCYSQMPTSFIPNNNSEIYLNVYMEKKQCPIFEVKIFSYNWQQGCRAHWLDSDLIIFNDFNAESNNYLSRVYSVNSGKQVRFFDHAVQDSFDKNYFISINYRRLMALSPDYGYRNLAALSPGELERLDNDGIWKIDYKTGKSRLLISLGAVCDIDTKPDFESALHQVNHVMISPSGRQFIYLHRYFIGKRRFDRLMLADASSGRSRVLADYGMVSHCFWADEHTILGYLRGPGNKDGYWLIDIESGSFEPCVDGKLDRYGDGHPHVQGDWFVTDTYPDKARMQTLLLANWKTGEVRKLGEFFHGFEYAGECRCDLHPRLSPDGRKVFFDSVFTGKRQLYCMDIEP